MVTEESPIVRVRVMGMIAAILRAALLIRNSGGIVWWRQETIVVMS